MGKHDLASGPKRRRAPDVRATRGNVLAVTELEQISYSLPKTDGRGDRESAKDKHPFVVLKYFNSQWECFSDWQHDELKQFSSFLDKLSRHTWHTLYMSGGKGENKSGLGYTPYEVDQMSAGSQHLQKILGEVSSEIDFFELRLSRKLRVHGFQSHAGFFLVLLDREHRVFS